MENSNQFNPILCFARHPTQTPEEVFEMLQERMITMLGHAYSEKGISVINWKPGSDADNKEIEAISDWQHTDIVFDACDFDRLGKVVNLSIADVLGPPQITPAQSKEIIKQLDCDLCTDTDIDPAAAFVVFSALDVINEMVKFYKQMLGIRPEAL